MSQQMENEPAVSVQRKTVLPAHYNEYDLTEFTLPVTQPMSPLTHSTRLVEGDGAEKGATGLSPLLVMKLEVHYSGLMIRISLFLTS